MADVSGIRTNWSTVSYADWQANNSTAVNNRITASALNTIGQAIVAINAELGGGVDLSNAPPIYQSRTTSDTVAKWKTELNGSLDLELQDVAQHWVNGYRVAWQNEWGAFRGTSPHSWGDAVVRGIREDWDGLTAGRVMELVDRRTEAFPAPNQVMWGRKWRDGMLVRNGYDMSDTWIRNGADPIPPYLPEGTIVVQI